MWTGGRDSLTRSSSLSDAGETSEWRRSSGLRGGASAAPLLGASVCVLLPSLASEWRRCSASSTGTSSVESVESCGMQTREAILRRQTLQRHMFCKWQAEEYRVKINAI